MKISIHCIGYLKEAYWKMAVEEYLKRLMPYAQVKIEEYPDVPSKENATSAMQEKVKDEEGNKILKKLKDNDYLIALDLNQKQYGSEEFSAHLMNAMEKGGSHVHFVIGGSLGLSDALKKRANESVCLSKMTFTHQMTRIILLEQIYRAFKIAHNEPYHK
ncbi:MAG: 23S rRNA (pseudouridine(1915)-N(3))-methyltransferase RlmH [Bacillota bacterium]|nr:23S rRNA (pseudouridine(1915)-N(3))-methyltransferase RlmH [Bacillota bacterium]